MYFTISPNIEELLYRSDNFIEGKVRTLQGDIVQQYKKG